MTLRMQNYMEKHKIGPLFEDLMNKVLRDMPEDPLVYVLRAVYKKAGLEIPQDIRHGGLRKSPSGMARGRSRSPDKMPVSSSADAALGTRDYDRPWKSQAKRLKPKKSSDDAELSRSQSSRLPSAPLSDSTVGELLRVTPVKLGRCYSVISMLVCLAHPVKEIVSGAWWQLLLTSLSDGGWLALVYMV